MFAEIEIWVQGLAQVLQSVDNSIALVPYPHDSQSVGARAPCRTIEVLMTNLQLYESKHIALCMLFNCHAIGSLLGLLKPSDI